MPYCRKCGAKLDLGVTYCPSCGTPVQVSEREEGIGTVGRILLLVSGGVILLVAFGLFVGGGALLWVNTGLTDSEGFITTRSHQLQRDSYAIAMKHVDIDVGEVVGPGGVWRPSPGDFVTAKISGYSNKPGKTIFIGIAEELDVQAYLANVHYDEVTRFSFSSSLSPRLEYVTHSGDAMPQDPISQDFWTASKHGPGTQTLEWAPEPGSYWIVLMNGDGSFGVDITMSLGAKIPLLSTIGLALLAGGVFALLISGVMLYAGIRR